MAYNNDNIQQWHFRHDALEAVNSFTAARNLFFCVTVICLLIIQGVFLSVNLGSLDSALGLSDMPGFSDTDSKATNPAETPPASLEQKSEQAKPADMPGQAPAETPTNIHNDLSNEIKLSSVAPGMFSFCLIVDEFKAAQPAGQNSPATDSKETSETQAVTTPAPVLPETDTQNTTGQAATDAKGKNTELVVPKTAEPDKTGDTEKTAEDKMSNNKTAWNTLNGLVKAADTIIVFAIVMYCLCLLVSIQVSLSGHLGGLASLTKAFFSTLLAVLLLLPWARAFYPDAPSMLFTFDELILDYVIKNSDTGNSLFTILYYGKYCALWLIVLLLVIVSQWRSFSATKQITARLTEWKTINPFNPPVVNNVNPSVVVAEPVKPEDQGPIPLE